MMSVNDFIKLREKNWDRLQQLIHNRKGRGRLSAAEVRELGTLYRAVTSDLAIARRDYPNQRVTQFLNQLLTQVHSYIYQADVADYKRLFRYFTHVIPQSFRRAGVFISIAFLMLFVPAGIGFLLAYNTPDVAETLGLETQREILANQETWTNIPVEDRPYASSFIMTNNIRVAILAFGGGITFGLFSFYILSMNGLHLGAILGLAAHYGQGRVLLDFIFAHGVVELSVIFIVGGAGMQMGWALIHPGRYKRKDAVAVAAREAVPLIVIAIPLLIGAGIIEGFLSPSSRAFIIKVMVGLLYGVLMYSYFLLSGHGEQVEV